MDKKMLKRLAALGLCFALLAGCGGGEPPAADGTAAPDGADPSAAVEETPEPLPPMADPTDDNYRVFYQIFVGSFSDSDGDGTGDLRGIIDRLDYLNDGDINSGESLGVQGLWLSPVFKSPSYHKYDVEDYKNVDAVFGTNGDLQELVEKCHERNVEVILDLVLNHTSTRHAWFTKFQMAHAGGDLENEYYDFYSWRTEEDEEGGRTWQPIPGCAGEYYECNFSGDMPELNYDNEAVRQKVVDVARYWLDMGVDGFRFDAVKYVYYGETARNVEFWQWYMDQLRAMKADIYCVGECWSGESEILSYYPAMNCFNFGGATAEGAIAAAAKGGNINNYTGYVCSWQAKMKEMNANGMMIPFISNHDMDRSAGYLMMANSFTKMGASLYLLGPGSPFIYYGEEIGLKGTRGSDNTDANRRLRMLWGDSDPVKDPVGSTYDTSKQTNGTVASQTGDPDSLLSHYQKLIDIRARYPEIARGEYTQLNFVDNKVGGFTVTYQGSAIAIVHNVDQEKELKVAWLDDCPFTELAEVVGAGEASFDGVSLTIGPQTTVILK